jgi:hypothetical protein
MLGFVAVAVLSTAVPWAESAAPTATASESVVMELAQRYAPYVLVESQPVPCGDGEPYAPSDVGDVLGHSDVVLR